MTEKTKRSRRRLLKTIATGGGVITIAKALPENWARPVVDSVLLPVHAVATGYILTCEKDPDVAAITDDQIVNVVVTIKPNPGVNEDVRFEHFCDDTLVDDYFHPSELDGTAETGIHTPASNGCNPVSTYRVRASYMGGQTECSWDVVVATNCILHGSLVMLARGGYSRIEELEIGSLVRSMDAEGSLTFGVVTKVIKDHYRADHYCINGELFITDDHPILVLRDNQLKWVRVDNLQVGDAIKSPDDYTNVSTLEKRNIGAMTVYMETNSGNFIVKAGDARYVVKSTYASPGLRVGQEEEQIFCLA